MKSLEQKKQPRHGIVVVINNKLNPEDRIKKSNLETYILLQALEHGFNVKITGSKQGEKMIERIRKSKVPIKIIDAFSEGNANENNNVGLARKIGTETALKDVKEKGFVISTDADTTLGSQLFELTKIVFESSEIDALEYNIHSNSWRTDEKERKANNLNALYWRLIKMPGEDSLIESSIVWMSGGGSSFTKKAYQATGGYQEIPGEEDTRIGISISDAGMKVDKAIDNALYVSTRARISERASTGYGKSIGGWDEGKEPFFQKKMSSYEYFAKKNQFLESVHTIYDVNFDEWLHEVDYKEDKIPRIFSSRSLGDKYAEKFFNDKKQKILSDFKELCERTFAVEQKDFFIPEYEGKGKDVASLIDIFESYRPNQISSTAHHNLFKKVDAIFQALYPKTTVSAFILDAEKHILERDRRFLKAVDMKLFEDSEFDFAFNYYGFERDVLAIIKSLGIDMDDNNIRAKVKASILPFYNEYFELLLTSYEQLKQRENYVRVMEKRSAENEKIKNALVLDKISTPEKMIFINTYGSYKLQILNALESVNRTFSGELKGDEKKAWQKIAKKEDEEYEKFRKDTYGPWMKEYKTNTKEVVKTLEGLLKVAEKEEEEAKKKEDGSENPKLLL